MLIVYVDDIVVTSNDTYEIFELKAYLGKEFEIKDLRRLKYFLGIQVVHSTKGIVFSQRNYTLDLLLETGMLGCKHLDTPNEVSSHLRSKEGETVDKGPYQRLVERLIYLSYIRQDIAHAISLVPYMIIALLLATYCTFVDGNLVTWHSKKQSVVARSSAEAKFRAMAHGICELLWL
ncbi:uncharacterized mitochondrial protein AtMg00810-like [Macadamia integrifolia]|uniref:uncharacterized mitochondrial protein AtMg00810-like n=1 Tax=Macadamia integrifolia TaxID=60698 RepID=UPI001C4EFFA6|nr:uncharacterized mitochondrial protein AtMg00810-like [Macadamia integrifolia]